MEDRVFGLITARGGSKRLPGKHLKCIEGIPLLQICIEEALKAKLLDAVILSTDDEELAALGRNWGAEVPFLRPKELAGDDARSVDVILHAAEATGRTEQTVCLLQPTSPFRSFQHIDEAIAQFRESADALSLMSVQRTKFEKSWLKEMDSTHFLQAMDAHEPKRINRGEGRPLYQLNGALYVMRIRDLAERQTFHTERTLGFVMSCDDSVDIDEDLDLEMARIIARKRCTV